MTVMLNGEPREVPDGATVSDVLAGIGPGLDRRGTAVVVNGEVVPRTRWDAVALSDGDRVEVLGAMQGGDR
jgi:sulfur carrier protein